MVTTVASCLFSLTHTLAVQTHSLQPRAKPSPLWSSSNQSKTDVVTFEVCFFFVFFFLFCLVSAYNSQYPREKKTALQRRRKYPQRQTERKVYRQKSILTINSTLQPLDNSSHISLSCLVKNHSIRMQYPFSTLQWLSVVC